mmetsp:Transcript_56566/g.183915  ORF Transcript_56566/g.183915 Transcript_56566/m.183915 type:complete len:266 (+) Transcript_56566:711-1508(+)
MPRAHVPQEPHRQAFSELLALGRGLFHGAGEGPLHELAPGGFHISRHGQVVTEARILGRNALVDETSREIEHVTGLEQDVQNGLPQFGLLEISGVLPRQRELLSGRRFVEPPALRALDLEHEDLHIVEVRGEALPASGRDVGIGSEERAERALQVCQQPPHGLVKLLRVHDLQRRASCPRRVHILRTNFGTTRPRVQHNLLPRLLVEARDVQAVLVAQGCALGQVLVQSSLREDLAVVRRPLPLEVQGLPLPVLGQELLGAQRPT